MFSKTDVLKVASGAAAPKSKFRLAPVLAVLVSTADDPVDRASSHDGLEGSPLRHDSQPSNSTSAMIAMRRIVRNGDSSEAI